MAGYDLRCVQDEFSKNCVKTSHFEFLCTKYLETIYEDLETSFNTVVRKKFLKSLPDAYSKSAKKIFYMHGCCIHGHFINVNHSAGPSTALKSTIKPCPYLPIGTTSNNLNIYGEIYGAMMAHF